MINLTWYLQKESKRIANFDDWENAYIDNQKNAQKIELKNKVVSESPVLIDTKVKRENMSKLIWIYL